METIEMMAPQASWGHSEKHGVTELETIPPSESTLVRNWSLLGKLFTTHAHHASIAERDTRTWTRLIGGQMTYPPTHYF